MNIFITLMLASVAMCIILYPHLTLIQGSLLHMIIDTMIVTMIVNIPYTYLCIHINILTLFTHIILQSCVCIYAITLAMRMHTCPKHVLTYTYAILTMYTHIYYKPLLTRCCLCCLVHDTMSRVSIFKCFPSCLFSLVHVVEAHAHHIIYVILFMLIFCICLIT